MFKVAELQNNFYRMVFQKDHNQINFVSSNHQEERLAIYRQTIFENLRNSLAITFPGIWKLLGETCANSVAYTFCKDQANLPVSGCLDDWGSKFPNFLSQLKELQHLPYLKDYAFYEWLKHESYGAKQTQAIIASDLTAISEDLVESIGFSFLPSVFLFTSEFPIDKIQEIIEDPTEKEINLNSNKAYALIARLKNEVLTFWITKDLWQFLKSLEQGLNIKQALEKQNSDFNLIQAIHFLLQKQLIEKINEKIHHHIL